MTILLAALILLNLAMLVAGWRLYRRTARAAEDSRTAAEGAQRARWMREMETKERWATLDLDRLHPVNRDEAAALLRRIEGASTRVLSKREREFLDRMVEAERREMRRAARGPVHQRGRPAHP
jgi:hypothetical protein